MLAILYQAVFVIIVGRVGSSGRLNIDTVQCTDFLHTRWALFSFVFPEGLSRAFTHCVVEDVPSNFGSIV